MVVESGLLWILNQFKRLFSNNQLIMTSCLIKIRGGEDLCIIATGIMVHQALEVASELHKEGIIPHVQVHDELDISIGSEKEAQRIKDIMEGAVTLEVPNKVDYEFGKNWGEIK